MDELKKSKCYKSWIKAVAFFKLVFLFLHGVMAFQPLMCLFILFADDIFQTENFWALIGTYLLSLIIAYLFNLLYLIVMLIMNISSISMPTFKYSPKGQKLERRRLLFKVLIVPLYFLVTLCAMTLVIHRLSSSDSADHTRKTRNLVVYLVTLSIACGLVLFLVLNR